jgi:hypothetical protein
MGRILYGRDKVSGKDRGMGGLVEWVSIRCMHDWMGRRVDEYPTAFCGFNWIW